MRKKKLSALAATRMRQDKVRFEVYFRIILRTEFL